MTREEKFKNTYETNSDEIEIDGLVEMNTTGDMIVIYDGRGEHIDVSMYSAYDLIMSVVKVIHLNNDDRVSMLKLMIESIEGKTYRIEFKCTKCRDTGKIKYKNLDVITDRSWVPWKTKKCDCGL